MFALILILSRKQLLGSIKPSYQYKDSGGYIKESNIVEASETKRLNDHEVLNVRI